MPTVIPQSESAGLLSVGTYEIYGVRDARNIVHRSRRQDREIGGMYP